MSKFKITKKILAKEENQVDSRLYEIISKNIQIRMLGNDRNDLFKMLLQLQSQLDQLKQQVEEKDKEIEGLKTKRELTFIHSKEDYFQRCNLLEEANIKLQFTQTQLAIQELKKVKELLLYEYKKYPIVYDKTNDIVAGALDRDKVNEIIDQQIEKLKGEHNE